MKLKFSSVAPSPSLGCLLQDATITHTDFNIKEKQQKHPKNASVDSFKKINNFYSFVELLACLLHFLKNISYGSCAINLIHLSAIDPMLQYNAIQFLFIAVDSVESMSCGALTFVMKYASS